MTEMKGKVGNDPGGGSTYLKKRKDVGNASPLASMFQEQQTDNDLQQARKTYNAILEKGKQLGFDEADAFRACAPVRKRHTCHSRVGY